MPTQDFLKSVIIETSKIGLDITDIAGDVESLSQSSVGFVKLSGNISQSSQKLLAGSQNVSGHVTGMQTVIQKFGKDILESKEMVKVNTDNLAHAVADVTDIAEQVSALKKEVERIGSVDGQEAGALILALTQRIATLSDKCESSKGKVQEALGNGFELDSKMDTVSSSFDRVEHQSSQMTSQVKNIQQQADMVNEGVDGLRDELSVSDKALGAARERINRLIGYCEQLVSLCVSNDEKSEDGQLLKKLKFVATEIEVVLETALKRGEITLDDLFDEKYVVVPRSNPKQVTTKFLKITDQYFPKIQEAALDINPHIVFCAAVDRNGYLPTHNLKFSKPQGENPIWNAANCRNQRIFNDRVGLAAGRNTLPFLIQLYRRDMGGGNFALMKDMSIPLYVRGRHWGGVRLAYLVDDGV